MFIDAFRRRYVATIKQKKQSIGSIATPHDIQNTLAKEECEQLKAEQLKVQQNDSRHGTKKLPCNRKKGYCR